MKQLSLIFSLVMLFGGILTSCSKDDDNNGLVADAPGQIAGLGKMEGTPTGTPFVLPEGVALNGKINGLSSYGRSAVFSEQEYSGKQLSSDMLRASQSVDTVLGSGRYVRVFIPLKNTTANDITVTFPTGLIILSTSGTYQNGLLIKKASVVVPAQSSYNVGLLMYCANSSKSSSSTSEVYEWGVVSNSTQIMQLCGLFANKKVNIEEFADSELYIYRDQVYSIQGIVWSVTDSQYGLSEADIQQISAIPNS